MRLIAWIPIVVVAALAALTTACLPAMDFGTASPDAGAVGVDDARIVARVANGAYRRDPSFTAVTRQSYTSAIAPANVNVWVTTADYAAYTRIAPDKSGSGSSLSPGAIIVREVLDANGGIAKVTLMSKGPAGYNPMVGDFWFGVIKPDGTPMADSSGAMQMGKVQSCFGCHMSRAADGFLFGVPAIDRAGGPVAGGGSDLGVAGDMSGAADMSADSDMCTGGRRGNGKCGGDSTDGGSNP